MIVVTAVTGAAMRVEVHRMNSTRRLVPADSVAALLWLGIQLDVRFSLRELETQLTHPRPASTIKLMTGFRKTRGSWRNHGPGMAPSCLKTAPN